MGVAPIPDPKPSSEDLRSKWRQRVNNQIHFGRPRHRRATESDVQTGTGKRMMTDEDLNHQIGQKSMLICPRRREVQEHKSPAPSVPMLGAETVKTGSRS